MSTPSRSSRRHPWRSGKRKEVKFKYLYQDRQNRNREGWIDARSRDEAYTKLRKQGVRPYRVIGEDPWNWRPLAITIGYAFLCTLLVALSVIAMMQAREIRELQAERAWMDGGEFR